MAVLNDGPGNAKATGERIAKIIARSGLCSRRDAEALIGEKRVSVNGAIIESPAIDILPADKVLVDGKPLAVSQPPRLWRYYKPKGRVTTHKDPEGRPTVFEALPEELPRMISVGRLDFNTEGLLLLTNDGDLARHLELPSTGWTRRYRVRAYGRVEEAKLRELAGGITIGKINYGPIEATLEREQGDNIWIALSIREGKNREVRRIMEHLDLSVNRLIRVSFGPFMLGDLEPGQLEEVKTSVLKDQIGPRLSRQLGVKREPMREDRKLAPARAKPTYLRRKPGAPVRPPRPEDEELPLKRRRILPIDGSEAPKVEFVSQKKPRPDRFNRNEGDRALRPNRREDRSPREGRERPAGREGGERRSRPYGADGSPGASFRAREAKGRDFGRDGSERRDRPAPFRKRPDGERSASPRFDRAERGNPQSGTGAQRRDHRGGDRPSYAARKERTGEGERPARAFGAERRGERPRPQTQRDAEGTRPRFETRPPREGKDERPRTPFRRGAEGARGGFDGRKPRREGEDRPRSQFRSGTGEARAPRVNRETGEKPPYRDRDKLKARAPREGRVQFGGHEAGERSRPRTTAQPEEHAAFKGRGAWKSDRPAGNPSKRFEGDERKRGAKGRPTEGRTPHRADKDRPRHHRSGGTQAGQGQRPRPDHARKQRPEADKETK